jgi:hypothetical protein
MSSLLRRTHDQPSRAGDNCIRSFVRWCGRLEKYAFSESACDRLVFQSETDRLKEIIEWTDVWQEEKPDPDMKLGQDRFIVRDADGHALAYMYFGWGCCAGLFPDQGVTVMYDTIMRMSDLFYSHSAFRCCLLWLPSTSCQCFSPVNVGTSTSTQLLSLTSLQAGPSSGGSSRSFGHWPKRRK